MAEKGLARATPEAVAYQLLQHVLVIEKPVIDHLKQKWGVVRRAVILDFYVECLEAVLGQRKSKTTSGSSILTAIDPDADAAV